MKRLSDYVDFPGPIQFIAVLNCQNELTVVRKELVATSPKMHFERFVSKEVLKSRKNALNNL